MIFVYFISLKKITIFLLYKVNYFLNWNLSITSYKFYEVQILLTGIIKILLLLNYMINFTLLFDIHKMGYSGDFRLKVVLSKMYNLDETFGTNLEQTCFTLLYYTYSELFKSVLFVKS